jgi:hypothetical protein
VGHGHGSGKNILIILHLTTKQIYSSLSQPRYIFFCCIYVCNPKINLCLPFVFYRPGAQELNSNSEPMEVMYSLIELEEDSEPMKLPHPLLCPMKMSQHYQ